MALLPVNRLNPWLQKRYHTRLPRRAFVGGYIRSEYLPWYEGGWSPASLFADGEQGVWYDPSDLSTLFQDHDGTIPADYGQPVGLMLDKSGRGNHASQPTVTARPTLGRVPKGGRRNLLLSSQRLSDAIWVGNVDPITADGVIAAPDGTMTGSLLTIGEGGKNRKMQTIVAAPSEVLTLSLYVKKRDSDAISPLIYNLTTAKSVVTGRVDISSGEDVGNGWYRHSFTATSGISVGDRLTVGSYVDASYAVGAGNYFWGFQAEAGPVATPYQRVGASAFDVTEAGVETLTYLDFDGVDDFMVSSTITPGTDKVHAFAGFRKLGSATVGIAVELGVNLNTENGAFYFSAPLSASGTNYSFASKGTAPSNILTQHVYPPPTSNILTGTGDISGNVAALRVDGQDIGQLSLDQGTGDYLPGPLYMGARRGSLFFYQGRIYGLGIRFGGGLSMEKIEAMEAFLASKTGVTL